MSEFINECMRAVGASHVLTNAADMASYLTDWRRRFTGKACAVVRPGTTEEVAAIVKICNAYRVPIVPQGGNTGLVLGSIPDATGKAIVLSLTRMNRIRKIDPVNNTMTVEAGCILAQIQAAAADVGRLFPLSLAAEGSCTIGGNLSTNAGGTAVLRYGNARDLCLGLEVVTPTGEIWNGLQGLRKDNTGYDLRGLFIGAEGTLGIITAAVVKLFPQPRTQLTALAGLSSPERALQLLTIAQQKCGAVLTGFELMSNVCLELVTTHFPQLQSPLSEDHSQYVLLEISDTESDEHAMEMLEDMLGEALDLKVVDDAVVATSIVQSQTLWSLREHIALAQAQEGKNVKHDVSVPISRIGDFIRVTDALLQDHFPGCRMVTFGHVGDGNLHYNVSAPMGVDADDFILHQHAVNRVVHDSVHAFDGSISAEHGLGALKAEEIRRYKSPVELQLMRTLKQALDPAAIMNPGKVISS